MWKNQQNLERNDTEESLNIYRATWESVCQISVENV